MGKTGDMLDRMTIFADHIARVLPAGEQPLVAVGVGYFAGREDDGTEKARLGLGDRLVANLLSEPIYVEQVDGVLVGHSLRARPGTLAAQMRTALQGVTQADCLLTQHRLLLVADLAAEQPVVTWQCPLVQVKTMVTAPRLGQLGRVVVAFCDGSWIALMLGILLRGQARRLVAAWESVRPR